MSIRLSPPAYATAEALPEIAALLQRVFPRERPWAPDLEWQYIRSPAGAARFVNAYSESGALVAHYALVPTPPLAEPPMALLTVELMSTPFEPFPKGLTPFPCVPMKLPCTVLGW